MGTITAAQQTTRRKKWITRLVVGGFCATTFVVAVAFWWGSTHQEKLRVAPQALPQNVHQQLSGYSFTRSDEGRRIFTVRAVRTVALKEGGTTILEDVSVEIFGREANRHDILQTRQCEYHPQTGDLFSSGTVEIELNAPADVRDPAPSEESGARRRREPLFLQTSQVSFQQGGSLVQTDQPVRFRIGPASGSARGMTYATKAGWLELKKEVAIQWGPRNGGTGTASGAPIRLTASRLRYEPARGTTSAVTLAGPVQITQGERRVLAGAASVFLDEHNRVTQAILEGHVQASESADPLALTGRAQRVRAEFDPASGRLRVILAEGDVLVESRRSRGGFAGRLSTQQFKVSFRGSRPLPEGGEAVGDVQLVVDPPRAVSSDVGQNKSGGSYSLDRRTLFAPQVRFDFRPGTWNLSEMHTVGPGKLVLDPSDPRLGERIITAGQFLMVFENPNRLKTLQGFFRTQIVLSPPRNAPPATLPQESSSERLEASFDPATQALRQVEQIGDFKFTDGERQASADRARYVASPQVFTLLGHPQIWDAEAKMSAKRILVDLRTGTAEGLGKVQATHFAEVTGPRGQWPSPQQSAGAPAGDLRADEPTHVTADRMLAQRSNRVVRYEGRVRAWHEADVVQSSWLDIYRAERRLSAGSPVLTSSLQPDPLIRGAENDPRARGATRPVLIRADRLEYYDEGHKALYRGSVQLQTENTVLKGDRLDVYLSNSEAVGSAEIERAVAEGHVTVTQPTRRASGEQAEYDTGTGKIVLTGGPPILYDTEKGSTTGERLTFFVHDDRLLVDGGEKSPAISKHRIAQ